jgi:hypothetical protein
MKLPWMKKADSEAGEIEFPDDLKKKIEDGASAATDVKEIKTKLGKLDSIDAFITEFKAGQEEVKRKAAAAAAAKTSEDMSAELEELMLTDPKKATEVIVKNATRDSNIALMTLRADNIKREVFENEKDFPYYHGDIKKEVDALIAGQPLNARNDKSVVENCYKTIVGNHVTEIVEGKLKNRFAGADGGGRGTSSGSAGSGTGTGDGEASFDSLRDKEEIARAAKQLGFKPDEYRKMLDQEGIGYA